MLELAKKVPRFDLLPPNANKDTVHRINKFTSWLTNNGGQWHSPDLAAYRDALLKDYAPSTVSAHLSTVRAQYASILRDNATRDLLYQLAG